MPPKKPYEPIDPNPLAHLMKSERFTPPERQDCREMTVTDPSTGEQVLMLKRGFGGMAVWKPAEQWEAENRAMWDKFYKDHPAPPPLPEYGTYLGDFDGNGDYPSSSGTYVQLIQTAAPERKGRFEGWNGEPTDVKKSVLQVVLETIVVIVFLAIMFLTLFVALSGG